MNIFIKLQYVYTCETISRFLVITDVFTLTIVEESNANSRCNEVEMLDVWVLTVEGVTMY